MTAERLSLARNVNDLSLKKDDGESSCSVNCYIFPYHVFSGVEDGSEKFQTPRAGSEFFMDADISSLLSSGLHGSAELMVRNARRRDRIFSRPG